MTSALILRHYGLVALLMAGVFSGLAETRAEEPPVVVTAVTDAGDDQAVAHVDREKVRLELLLSLVQNELQAAQLSKGQLTAERIELVNERDALLADPAKDRPSSQIRLETIGRRLDAINAELADIDAKLPDTLAELDDLQHRLDKINGVVQPAGSTADDKTSSASLWLDGNRRVQEALVYLGGYNAMIDGDFGPRTKEAIRTFQQSQALEPTGVLTDEQKETLLKEADLVRALYGVRTFDDSEAGYRLTYPARLLSQFETTEDGSRRMTTADGNSELLITVTNGSAELNEIYDETLGRYEVQYRRVRDDWFVVAGLVDDERVIYDTARQIDHNVIRARLTYPAAERELWAPFAVILFNSLAAIPAGES